jgi:hypothetical protein
MPASRTVGDGRSRFLTIVERDVQYTGLDSPGAEI